MVKGHTIKNKLYSVDMRNEVEHGKHNLFNKHMITYTEHYYFSSQNILENQELIFYVDTMFPSYS